MSELIKVRGSCVAFSSSGQRTLSSSAGNLIIFHKASECSSHRIWSSLSNPLVQWIEMGCRVGRYYIEVLFWKRRKQDCIIKYKSNRVCHNLRSSITEKQLELRPNYQGWGIWRAAAVIPTADSSTSLPGPTTRNTTALVAPTPSLLLLSNGAKIHSQNTALLGKSAYSFFYRVKSSNDSRSQLSQSH